MILTVIERTPALAYNHSASHLSVNEHRKEPVCQKSKTHLN